MSIEFQSNLVHCILVVAETSPEIPSARVGELCTFLAGAVDLAGAKQLAAGGTENHIHMLVSLPPTLAPADIVNELKLLSTRWIQETFPFCRSFRWSHGYTSFSVGAWQLHETVAYIERQFECHRRIDYRTEITLFGDANRLKRDIETPHSLDTKADS